MLPNDISISQFEFYIVFRRLSAVYNTHRRDWLDLIAWINISSSPMIVVSFEIQRFVNYSHSHTLVSSLIRFLFVIKNYGSFFRPQHMNHWKIFKIFSPWWFSNTTFRPEFFCKRFSLFIFLWKMNGHN